MFSSFRPFTVTVAILCCFFFVNQSLIESFMTIKKQGDQTELSPCSRKKKLAVASGWFNLQAPITTAADDKFFNIFPNL